MAARHSVYAGLYSMALLVLLAMCEKHVRKLMGIEERFDAGGREPLIVREVVKRQTERVNEG